MFSLETAKNELQELCQKHCQSLPSYITENYKDGYRAMVTMPEAKMGTFVSTEKRTKKLAEKDAALRALKELNKTNPELFDNLKRKKSIVGFGKNSVFLKYKPPPQNNVERIVLVDAESIPQSLTGSKFGKWNPLTDYLVGFAGYCSSQASAAQSKTFQQLCEFHITESPTADAADHALSFYAGRLAERYRSVPSSDRPLVMIISRDKFAATTVERLLDAGFENVRHISRPPSN
jgi:hypothetical protein